RPPPLSTLPTTGKVSDVAQRRTQEPSRKTIRNQKRRHGVARGTDRTPDRAHQWSHGAFQVTQERQSFAARPSQNGEPAPASARPYQGQGRGALPEDHRAFGNSPLAGTLVRRGSKLTLPYKHGHVGRLPQRQAPARKAMKTTKHLETRRNRCSKHNAWKSSGRVAS